MSRSDHLTRTSNRRHKGPQIGHQISHSLCSSLLARFISLLEAFIFHCWIPQFSPFVSYLLVSINPYNPDCCTELLQVPFHPVSPRKLCETASGYFKKQYTPGTGLHILGTITMTWSCCCCETQNSGAFIVCQRCGHRTLRCIDCFSYDDCARTQQPLFEAHEVWQSSELKSSS